MRIFEHFNIANGRYSSTKKLRDYRAFASDYSKHMMIWHDEVQLRGCFGMRTCSICMQTGRDMATVSFLSNQRDCDRQVQIAICYICALAIFLESMHDRAASIRQGLTEGEYSYYKKHATPAPGDEAELLKGLLEAITIMRPKAEPTRNPDELPTTFVGEGNGKSPMPRHILKEMRDIALDGGIYEISPLGIYKLDDEDDDEDEEGEQS